MPDYIPKRETDLLIWLTNFNAFAQGQGAALGLTVAQLTDLDSGVGQFGAALNDVQTQEALLRGLVADKNVKRTDIVALARLLAQFMQNNPAMTDLQRGQAGLTIPDVAPGPAIDISTIPPPVVILDFSKRHQLTVHAGVNPSDEGQNAKPEGVKGIQLEWARGGIPANEASWAPMASITKSPYVQAINENTAIEFAVRGRWVGHDLSTGPAGDPVTCTVSV